MPRVRIEKIIAGGSGLARLTDGMVVMLPFVLPGELVEIRLVRRFRGHLQAEAVEILEPSPHRRRPPCPLYSICGGCDLQHAEAEYQAELRKDLLAEALRRAGITPRQPLSLLPCARPLAYRHRLRLHLDDDAGLGFHRIRSNRVVPIESCPVAAGGINRVLQTLHDHPDLLAGLAGRCEEIELLQSPETGEVVMVIHLRTGKRLSRQTTGRLEELARHTGPAIDIRRGRVLRPLLPGRPAPLLRQAFPDTGGYRLEWDSGCFFQANAEQNRLLVARTCAMAGEVHSQRLLELHCGMGNFSVPLALRGARMTGVEQNGRSIRFAGRNMAAAGLAGHCFIRASTRTALARLRKTGVQFDCILLDPPRQGLGPEVALLAELAAPRIVYVSCDPATLARDLARLASSGYHLTRLTAVDMFPQTHHIESVALLEKN